MNIKLKYYSLFLFAVVVLGLDAVAQDNPANSTTLSAKPRRGTSPGVPDAHLNYVPGKAPKYWSVATAETFMARYPDYRKAYWKDWSYVQGYTFCGFEMLYKSTGDKKYLDYIKQYIDHFVDENGNYRGDKLTNLDNLMTGTAIVALYEYTRDERYKKAAAQFRKVFDTYPRSDGQFWHGNKSPNMWIDGIFMGQMFLIRYGKVIGDADYAYTEAARQITVFAKHCQKGNSGLYLHAWTEKPKETKWADTITGLSPEVWSEGLGWYSLVIPELLAVMPKDHPKRAEVEDIYLRLMAGLKNTQDPKTGGWYMIVDKGSEPGNWIDPSGTAMFVYSIQRGINLGLLNKKNYEPVAKRGYQSLLKFVTINEKGLVDVSGGGDGITIKKDFATYVNVSRILNAKEAVAGFLWASAIMEALKK
ncbi:MAG: glycoside hydrolase family 88 protein [Bacteroidota bacterium]|nr:glycoside hydrolase family 88 protein [Bacteroidota bacterium]